MSFTIKIAGFGNKREILTSETARYIRWLRPYANVSITLLKTSSYKKRRREQQVEEEGKRLMLLWPDPSYPIALSEEGKSFTSASFAEWLAKRRIQRVPLVITVGGAYGLAPKLKQECREILSLSPLTFPHRLCYHILLEQLYRACTILENHPYHK